MRLADMLERDFGKTGRLDGVINHVEKPRDEEELDNWKFICKITEMLDKHRKTSILNYIPQLEKYWVKNA